MPSRPRVIVALPDKAEAMAIAGWLSEHEFDPVRRPTPEAAARDVDTGAFDLLIADAMWAVPTVLQAVGRARNSAIATILIGDATDRRAGAAHAQTMWLTRPIEFDVLSCYVSMALMDSRPMRRSPRKAVPPFEVFVNQVPASILDVSVEGLRLEVSRVPPPYFAVQIPLVGVAVIARRMWAMSPPKRPSALWCGGALSHNRPSSEKAWRSFVDTVPVVGTRGL